ncbi:betaine--homocysteine S-methyltransferase 1-like isoform X1 [Dendronephthya gigantea]|uniref:betaine--homocysteine S-methyltransferase 1-like isoform X1 n=1 Tax=Dendronephthya gigantea TaxID=151771 RepID=UPI00106CE0FC|nr:betaine--homocysteine S-methyltransferase 1-like isoform X1 [Dendronephthya gigantea]XP_028416517.1 betaine--homocysteine S-methyltransferase 1-like isoform X1 [Dendronephthya gigantea]
MSKEAKADKSLPGILERLNAGEILIGDGGYITELEQRGYACAGPWTAEVTVEHPDAVEGLHKEFARAGSDVLQALTYAANDRLEKYQVGELEDVNESACNIVKKIAGKYDCLWAAGVSPTELYQDGSRSKKDVQEIFRQQVEIFVKQNPDFLIAELFGFCEELEWAVEVLKETGKPVLASMCITSKSDKNGVPTDECAVRLVKAGADIIGVNCDIDPSESLKSVAKMKEGIDKAGLKSHLSFQPLGYHCPDGGSTGYSSVAEWPYALEPRQLTRWDVHKLTRRAYDIGVRYFGGCCGIKSYHIRAISEELEKERGRKAESSQKHTPFTGKYSVTASGMLRKEEYWMKLKPASGQPYCPAFAELLK